MMSPYAGLMGPQGMPPEQPGMMPPQGMPPMPPQAMPPMPPNPHEIDPYTFTQGPGDRFPATEPLGFSNTQNLPQLQQMEQVGKQLEFEKIEADRRKDQASYDSKMISFAKNQLMEALQGNG